MGTENERRQQILRAAERLLEHYGLHKTTVSDIAREARVGVGTVYLEFSSKDDIIQHVSTSRHQGLLDALEEAAATDGPASKRLRAVLQARAEIFTSLTECGTHAADLVHCRCSPVESSWQRYLRAEQALVESVICDGIEAGEFRQDDPSTLASTVLRAYASFAPPYIAGRPECGGLDAMHDLVIRGLKA